MDLIVERDLTDMVLVGHSYGGTAISKVVELVPDRVRRLVYVAGFVLNDNESVEDAAPPEYRKLYREIATASADDTVQLPFDIWRHSFINDGDEDLARSTYARLWPEPYQPIIEPLDLKKFHSLPTPKSYILGSEDIAQPEGTEWGWHPRFTDRLGDHRFLEMPGSHEVIFTNPGGLAAKIIEAARD
jgi:pimeloyl-ACP methyl ester carboxylesterase